MNLAIAMRDYGLSRDYDYEPVSDVSEMLTRRWAQERNYLQGKCFRLGSDRRCGTSEAYATNARTRAGTGRVAGYFRPSHCHR